MSLLTSQQTFTPPTKEQRLANHANFIKSTAKQAYKQLIEIQRRGVQLVWEDKIHTPQEIIDALGDDAIDIFQYHGALTDLIKQLAVLDGTTADIKFPKNNFTVVNGKITVSNDPYTDN